MPKYPLFRLQIRPRPRNYAKNVNKSPVLTKIALTHTVNSILAKVVAEDQRNWVLYVSSSCFAYNTAVHSSTGYSPSYFELGENFGLPNDLVDSNKEEKHDVSHTEYAQQLKTRLTKAFKTAKDVLHTAHKT